MQTYYGTQIIKAKPMTLGEYNLDTGGRTPESCNPDTPGYLTEYMDGGEPNHRNYKGYVSWKPKDLFEKTYYCTGSMSFGHALIALKAGERVARKGWNGKGLFVFRQVPSSISSKIVPKMTSLPQTVKDEFERRFSNMPDDADIRYRNQLALVKPTNEINGWNPSTEDSLAKDWIILD